jgi:TetR/AcrR family transcriptional regulator, transcriptional repressor of bet genes
MARKREAVDVRREQILRAAFEVASREGIGSLTVRAVAAEAGLSHALVLFHFQRKERLVDELLEWLIRTTSVLGVSGDLPDIPGPRDRLHARLLQEVTRLSAHPRQLRLFLEFWALGARDERVRLRISAEMERYRASFRTAMAELLAGEQNADGMTADGLAAVAVSWIHGCALQAMIDPASFDTEEYLATVRGMIGRMA